MKKKQYKSRFKLSPLSESLDFVTKPIFNKRGFAQNKILTDWHLIVGNDLANFSTPKKLVFAKQQKYGATLHVEVYNSGKAMEITYNSSIIIEKIALYFGYKAVSKIKIIQKPDSNLNTVKSIPKKRNEYFQKDAVQSLLEDIDDEDIKESLSKLGLNIYY